MSTLDPAGPLVISTHDLGRAAGTAKKLTLTVPTPTNFGNAVIGVREHSDIGLELLLESVMDGVLVTGTAALIYQGECARCLDPIEQPALIEFQELFFYAKQSGDDEEMFLMHQEYLDLEPVLRDAALLDLPLAPVCDDDCLGLCARCGQRLVDDPDHRHEDIDPRWQALTGLLDN